MPDEPRLIEIRDDMKASLNLMSKANGYHYDYHPVKSGVAGIHVVKETSVLETFLEWLGPVDERGERPSHAFRHNEGWMVSFLIKAPDGDHEAMAFRARADVHKALLAGGRRGRGMSRVNTVDVAASWGPGDSKDGKQGGGTLGLSYETRWDHNTGDMSSQ